MTLEPAVIAPVVNHPSLPLDDPGGLELSAEDAAAVKERIDRDGLKVLSYRFDNDRWCTGQRFAAYRALLGEAFDGRVISGDAANASPPPFFSDVVGTPHSVTTAHLVDEEGHPTVEAEMKSLPFSPHVSIHTRREQLVLPGEEVVDVPLKVPGAWVGVRDRAAIQRRRH